MSFETTASASIFQVNPGDPFIRVASPADGIEGFATLQRPAALLKVHESLGRVLGGDALVGLVIAM